MSALSLPAHSSQQQHHRRLADNQGSPKCMLVGKDFFSTLMQCNVAFEATPFFCFLHELPFLLLYMYYKAVSDDLHTHVAEMAKTPCIGGRKKLPKAAQSSYDQLVNNERKFCESMQAVFGQSFESMIRYSAQLILKVYEEYPKKLSIFSIPEVSARVAPIREIAGKLKELLTNNWTMAIKVAQGLHYAQTCQRLSEIDDNSRQAASIQELFAQPSLARPSQRLIHADKCNTARRLLFDWHD